MLRVLVVDDDPEACEFMRSGLGESGYQVVFCLDGASAIQLAGDQPFDFLILDVMLPDIDGFDLLDKLRDGGVNCPCLFLSARDTAGDRIEGLNHGADDYLTKPFSFTELTARMKAILRRSSPGSDGRLQVADLLLDPIGRTVSRGGDKIAMSTKQFELLRCLMKHSGHVISREMITQQVWGSEFERYSNVIEVHINSMRKKIDRSDREKLIHTVKGAGYVLEDRSRAKATDRLG